MMSENDQSESGSCRDSVFSWIFKSSMCKSDWYNSATDLSSS